MKGKRIAVYPGSFDPVTNGHIDIVERASKIFDEIIVAVIENPVKKTMFSSRDRRNMLKKSLAGIRGARVVCFHGLLVRFLQKVKAKVIIRGLRAVSDFEFEFQMALMNRKLSKDTETVFLMPDEKYTYLSSSIIKEIAKYGGDIQGLVPHHVREGIRKCFRSIKAGEKM